MCDAERVPGRLLRKGSCRGRYHRGRLYERIADRLGIEDASVLRTRLVLARKRQWLTTPVKGMPGGEAGPRLIEAPERRPPARVMPSERYDVQALPMPTAALPGPRNQALPAEVSQAAALC